MGRNHSANKLRMWMTDMTNIYGPQVVQQITDPSEVGKRFADSYGIEDVESLIKDAQQVADENEANMANNAVMSAAPQTEKGAAAAMKAPEESGASTPTEGAD